MPEDLRDLIGQHAAVSDCFESDRAEIIGVRIDHHRDVFVEVKVARNGHLFRYWVPFVEGVTV